MIRKLSMAGVLVAVFSFTFGSADAQARQCRGQRRDRCCQQNNQNCQQTSNCQQTGNTGCQQTACSASTATACCTARSTCSNVQPTCGAVQPDYVTPASSDSPIHPMPATNAPAPAPSA
ncbi:MAG TPA: hypothetical protein VGZ73_02825 [Bryobacteraceae bacterium]|nr:hypothetical protein [Bryobacteraceae bacterium]